jgi:hypothetical protein
MWVVWMLKMHWVWWVRVMHWMRRMLYMRVLRVSIGRMRGLEVGDVGGDDLAFPFMLQLGENFFANAELVKFGLNDGDHLVNDCAVDSGLIGQDMG